VFRVLLTPRALLVGALAAATLAAAAPANAAQSFSIDHFQCYKLGKAKFKPRKVKLRDQFGRTPAKVVSRQTLCNPVSKNDEGIKDKTAHLVCYGLKSRAFKRRRVVVQHQFTDGMRLAVVRRTRLCLPSGKSEDDPKPQDIPKLDHYACYAVKPIDRFKPRDVKLEDQFGRVKGRVGRAFQLCNPVSKNGGEILSRRDHLVCHQLATEAKFRRRAVFVTNQFEKGRRVKVVRRESLCFPALKKVIKPDLTPTIIAPVSVSCPGGQGTCTTTVRYRVDNIGNDAAGAFDVLISADPGLATTTTQSVAGLAAGASTGILSATLGPANNCFDPNCAVSVRVDPPDVIDESDEGNNSAAAEFPG
jgi:hypothetical protein